MSYNWFFFICGEENAVLMKNKYKYLINLVLIITITAEHP